jgi:PAS domain S-box-containing protein
MTGDQRPFKSNKKLTEKLDVDFALQAVGIGIWELNPKTNQVVWDNRCSQLFGIDSHQFFYPDTLRFIHPADVERVNQAVQEAMNPQSDGHYDVTYRSLGEDGRTRWIRSTGKTYFDPDGQPLRFAGVAQEVTGQLEAQQRAEAIRQQAQRQQRIYEAITSTSPDLMYVFDLNYRFMYANRALLAMWGSTWEQSIGKGLLENGYEPWHAQMHEREIDEVVATKKTIRGEVSFPHATLGKRIYDYVLAPVLNEQGEVEAVAGTTRDITDIKQAQERKEVAQRQLLALFEQSPVGLATLSADDKLVFQWANPFYGELVARPPQTLVGKPLLEALPELKGQGFDDALRDVMATQMPFNAPEVAVDILRDGQLTTMYVNLTYQPQKGRLPGTIESILVVATDVTQQVTSRKKVEERDQFSRTIFYNSPVAKLVYVGPDMILREANEKMLALFGRDASIIGQPIMEVIPELTRTQLLEKYRRVLATGEMYEEQAEPIELIKDGHAYGGYYDYTYKPLIDLTGKPYGVICTAIDVTQQVMARQKLEEAEASLRGAIELAQLGTWSIDVATNALTFSDRLIEWFGYDPKAQSYQEVIPILEAGDQERINQAVARALNPESNGVYDETYTVIHPQTGEKRVLHAQGKTVFDERGKAVRMNGTAQDITLQQALQTALAQQVQERTEELARANEELAAINEELAANIEEYAAINEELEEANTLLHRSNENLEQFAYVASHDLQEPLRKIQQFGDLLKTRYTQASGEELVYLERMQSAAARMSMLIKDLLNFSRITNQRENNKAVALNQVLDEVLTDLDLRRAETKARIEVASLPVVEGDAGQLGQLFQNLLSNALKFHRPGEVPHIQVKSKKVSVEQLPPWVKPSRKARFYYQIEVIDNGIGFDEKYVDRIFQVFQRLHGKSQYAGTGIGLAICEKVVSNHGGAITAQSQVGKGATFMIYLPV